MIIFCVYVGQHVYVCLRGAIIYTHMLYICNLLHILYIYIYIYRERERERGWFYMDLWSVIIYIYIIYIYIYIRSIGTHHVRLCCNIYNAYNDLYIV